METRASITQSDVDALADMIGAKKVVDDQGIPFELFTNPSSKDGYDNLKDWFSSKDNNQSLLEYLSSSLADEFAFNGFQEKPGQTIGLEEARELMDSEEFHPDKTTEQIEAEAGIQPDTLADQIENGTVDAMVLDVVISGKQYTYKFAWMAPVKMWQVKDMCKEVMKIFRDLLRQRKGKDSG